MIFQISCQFISTIIVKKRNESKENEYILLQVGKADHIKETAV